MSNYPPTPPLNQHVALKVEVSVNIGLGEGWVDNFPETYKATLGKPAVHTLPYKTC